MALPNLDTVSLAREGHVLESDAEVRRGIYPFGGAAVRLPREAGWADDASVALARKEGCSPRAPRQRDSGLRTSRQRDTG